MFDKHYSGKAGKAAAPEKVYIREYHGTRLYLTHRYMWVFTNVDYQLVREAIQRDGWLDAVGPDGEPFMVNTDQIVYAEPGVYQKRLLKEAA